MDFNMEVIAYEPNNLHTQCRNPDARGTQWGRTTSALILRCWSQQIPIQAPESWKQSDALKFSYGRWLYIAWSENLRHAVIPFIAVA